MKSKEFFGIVYRNFFTPIVIAIYSLAIILLMLGEFRDAYFVSAVITINFTIGIIQEVRARLALRKLELMSAPRAHRILPNGRTEDVLYTELEEDDEIILSSGDEVPADAVVLSSKGLEVDESMLTGESASVDKEPGKMILASTAVVAGSARAKVVAVGASTRAGQMTGKLKEYIPEITPLQRRINLTISVLTYGAIGLSVLVIVVYAAMGENLVRIFKTVTSGAVVVVPEGLLLASTLLLAYGSLKLAAVKVLPQKLTAIEAMALLNVLCTDKTGTLTEPDVVFDKFIAFDDKKDSRYYRELIGITAQETSGGNATGEAIMAAFEAPTDYQALDIMAFSSERKMSGVRAKFGKHSPQVLFMGAPEYVSKLAHITKQQQEVISRLTSEGKRVLLVATSADSKTPLKQLVNEPKSTTALGLIILRNDLREGVVDTVDFLQQRGVSVRVISGDNPDTVKYIAKKAGIVNSDRVITGTELEKMNEKEWYKTAYRTVIFARVLPEQKERLVRIFQQQNKFVGMVGDGINDALALKKADLGVAMYSGAAASRRVSDIVLLDNSFNSLPIGMKLGNRIMQAIEIIATLFFHKIFYGIFLLLATMVLGIVYPFEPRHNTFMNVFLVTMPTIMWTLFPPKPNYRVNPKDFWRDTLMAVLPISVISGLTVTFSYWYMSKIGTADHKSVATTTVIIATFFGMYLVLLMPRLLRMTYDVWAKVARTLYIVAAVVVASVAFGFGFARSFFDFTQPAFADLLPVSGFIVVAVMLQWYIANRAGRRIARRESSIEQE
ncbi:HAD-IC family P-type ATPase [Candidatus Saccharibacteria bacterium]|jgi:cation-transporting ATPase E|nr:HAD-IC family P-type ATPase [Candidatus Saccharibacteria bacterium]